MSEYDDKVNAVQDRFGEDLHDLLKATAKRFHDEGLDYGEFLAMVLVECVGAVVVAHEEWPQLGRDFVRKSVADVVERCYASIDEQVAEEAN